MAGADPDHAGQSDLPSPPKITDVVDEPGRAVAEEGLVVLDGPRGLAITLTPAAALATADALRDAARHAREMQSANDVGGPSNDA